MKIQDIAMMKVKDAGIKEVQCASPSMNLAEIASIMKKYKTGVIPECERKKLVGILTARHLVISCMAADLNPGQCKASP